MILRKAGVFKLCVQYNGLVSNLFRRVLSQVADLFTLSTKVAQVVSLIT